MAVSIETSTSVTEAVARFAATEDFSSAADELLDRATRAIIDTVGVAIAARQEPSFTTLADTLGNTSDATTATVLPTRMRGRAIDAAFLNGVAGHALDFDDVADELAGHPSVVLLATLLALAEVHGSSGRELLEAYLAGFEVSCAIAAALPVAPHYHRGWHATSSVGILGAAAGAGRLLHLSQEAICHALGIAASMASGSRQNFGTMTKPLHAGMAARDALLAADLASRGFTADRRQLEGPLGYFRMYGQDADLARVADVLEQPPVLLGHGLNVKKYACCYNTHRMADAALALYARGVRGEHVRSVTVTVEPGGSQAIIHHRPRTGLEGKFSGEYVVAACLVDGGLRLATFTDAAVTRADAHALLRRISIEESATPPYGDAGFEHAYATLEVTLSDGSVVSHRCDVPRGDARQPLSDAELESKFPDCIAFSRSDWDADGLLEALGSLRRAPRVAGLF